MNRGAIVHSGILPDVYPENRRLLSFRLRTGREDAAECVLVIYSRTTPDRIRKFRMQCALRDGEADYYSVEVPFSKVARYQKYYFEIKGRDGEHLYLTTWGLQEKTPEDGFFEFLYANGKDCLRIPEWAPGQVYYQIFPDRFRNGCTENDPPDCAAWGSVPDREHFMGGDLQGILEKLDYLAALGIQCLYLTPIFKGDFNHKYATTDYFEIDPCFGSKEEFTSLVEGCHERGIRILLDGVFNHCGTHFAPFMDLLEKQEESSYKDWFFVTEYPVRLSHHSYECVGAYKWMPKLNTANCEVRKFILEVMDYWLGNFHIDGWRLDVADEVDGSVWTEVRTVLKEKYPDCLLLGETWGSGRTLMQGNRMDSIMNYIFRDSVRDFFARESIDALQLDCRLNHMLSAYSMEQQQALYNPLDSHDTERFLYQCCEDKRKLKLAAAFQFVFPGAPAIYYGDEIGLTGANDPDCRGAFCWEKEKQDEDLYDWYSRLIRLRREEKALCRGSFTAVLCDGRMYGFSRMCEEDELYVLLNAENTESEAVLPVLRPGTYTILFSGTEDAEKMEITAEWADGIHKQGVNADRMDCQGRIRLTAGAWSILVIKKKKEERGYEG